MNGKNTLYLLLALIAMMVITHLSYATPIVHKYNIEETLAYWTPERMKRAKPLVPKNIGIRNKKRYDVKTRDSINVTDSKIVTPFARRSAATDDFGPDKPIGMLFFTDSDTGKPHTCGAGIINTKNGNIGVTAGHCLIDTHGFMFNNLMFSPGYDHGKEGQFGRIPVDIAKVTEKFRKTYSGEHDYGIMRFAFKDPWKKNQPLQYYTGSLGWRFDRGNNVPTAVVGYPNQGNVQNCPNDAENLCLWRGEATLKSNFYTIPGVNFGNGVSGSPWIWNYDQGTNNGWLYGILTSFDHKNQESLSPIFVKDDFYELVDFVSNYK